MTIERLNQRNALEEVKLWFNTLNDYIDPQQKSL
jgi:hypothetical protein